MNIRALLCLAALAAAGCSSSGTSTTSTASSPVPAAKISSKMAKRSAPPGSSWNWLANGRSIFMTGKDLSGVPATAMHPPLRASCVKCHNADGSGGVHLPGGAVSADLRHKALVTDQKPPYTIPLLERAISKGIDNQGEALDPVMPRWRLSARDLHDIANYVFTQLK